MSKVKLHLRRVRKNAFGGETTTSLCGRLRTLSDGMNLTEHGTLVTCAFCLTKMHARAALSAATGGTR